MSTISVTVTCMHANSADTNAGPIHFSTHLFKITLFLPALLGLDPARPLVRGPNRLRNVDANVVQVIHTNAGVFGEGGPLGVIDFCVNGGREQPSCENKTRT